MAEFFSGNSGPAFSASAPGRLDVMGGIADYSGSLVLQMPIREQTTVTLALRQDGLLRVHTTDPEEKQPYFSVPYTELLKDGVVDYTHAREKISRLNGGRWATYVVGCILVLHREKGISFTGADILVDSQVPIGKGVSSSAALEVATMKALAEAYGLNFTGTQLPVWAQKAENLVVGAPCGVMDQLASFFGERGTLLPILCQPDHMAAPFSIPAGVRFVGIDSGVRHTVGGASYSDVRTAAFMGYSIIAQHNGTAPGELTYVRQTGDREQLLFNGYLANIEPSEFEAQFARLLPRQMSGADFLNRYQTTIDPVTEVKPERMYAVYPCTAHPIYENTRIQYFSLLLQHLPAREDPVNRNRSLQQLGEWMFQSHQSYSACGLGSEQTDKLVQLVQENKGSGVYGSRITGGGSGGTVCILCDGDQGLETAHRIHRQYGQLTGKKVAFFE